MTAIPREITVRWIVWLFVLVPAICGSSLFGRGWTDLGPDGGEIASVIINPKDTNILYATRTNGRIFKSTDRGAGWHAADKGLETILSTSKLAINPQKPDILYSAVITGLYRSMDGAENWEMILPYTMVGAVALDPSHPDTVYAGTYTNGIMKSTDGGGTWTIAASEFASKTISFIVVSPHDSEIIFVGISGTTSDSGGVYRSADGGSSWTAVGPLTSFAGVFPDPIDARTVYATSSSWSSSGYGIYKSMDSGLNWSELPARTLPGPYGVRTLAIDPKTEGITLPGPYGVRTLAIDPKTEGIIYAGTYSEVYRSIDGGDTWTLLTTLHGVQSLTIDPQDPSLLYAGTVKGVYISSESGLGWLPSIKGLRGVWVNALAADPKRPGTIYAATTYSVLKSTNGGQDWSDISYIENWGADQIVIDPHNPDTVFAMSGMILRSTDGGAHWEPRSPNAPIVSFALDPENSSVIYAGSSNSENYSVVYKSTDGGSSWTEAGKGLPVSSGDILSLSSVQSLVIDPLNTEVILAALGASGVYGSTDGGKNWAALNNGLNGASGYCLAVASRDTSTFYAGTNSGVFKSIDGGRNWIAASVGLPGLDFAGLASVRSLVVDPWEPETIYAGTFDGVYRTVNGGVNWTRLDKGVLNLVRSLGIDAKQRLLYVGTVSQGVWATSSGGSSVELTMNEGGAAAALVGERNELNSGYARLSVESGPAPYGTAVISLKYNGVVTSEVGVPATVPTTSARVFIEYRTAAALPGRSAAGTVDVTTGITVANDNLEEAAVEYVLRDNRGEVLAEGTGSIEAGRHFACFIDQLKNTAAPDFELPPDFAEQIQFGTLEITSDRPLSVLALRGTINQRGEFLMTTTPVADLARAPESAPAYFPQFVDGGGYATTITLLNPTGSFQSGTLRIRDKEGNWWKVRPVGGAADASIRYQIRPHGFFRIQTEGAATAPKTGWVLIAPDPGHSVPAASAVLAYNPADVLVTESGIPAAAATTRARIFVDLSGRHNTGLAIANIGGADSEVSLRAFEQDGVTPAGEEEGSMQLPARGQDAQFADQLIPGLPAGFTGVLEISASKPFAALSLRSLINERDEFLVTAFPVADANGKAPAPILFPHIAVGEGYSTQFILLSPAGESTGRLCLCDDSGLPMAFEEE